MKLVLIWEVRILVKTGGTTVDVVTGRAKDAAEALREANKEMENRFRALPQNEQWNTTLETFIEAF